MFLEGVCNWCNKNKWPLYGWSVWYLYKMNFITFVLHVTMIHLYYGKQKLNSVCHICQ